MHIPRELLDQYMAKRVEKACQRLVFGALGIPILDVNELTPEPSDRT